MRNSTAYDSRQSKVFSLTRIVLNTSCNIQYRYLYSSFFCYCAIMRMYAFARKPFSQEHEIVWRSYCIPAVLAMNTIGLGRSLCTTSRCSVQLTQLECFGVLLEVFTCDGKSYIAHSLLRCTVQNCMYLHLVSMPMNGTQIMPCCDNIDRASKLQKCSARLIDPCNILGLRVSTRDVSA